MTSGLRQLLLMSILPMSSPRPFARRMIILYFPSPPPNWGGGLPPKTRYILLLIIAMLKTFLVSTKKHQCKAATHAQTNASSKIMTARNSTHAHYCQFSDNIAKSRGFLYSH